MYTLPLACSDVLTGKNLIQWIRNELLYLAQWVVICKYKSSADSLPEGILGIFPN